MNERMKKLKHPLLIIIAFAAVAVLAYAGAHAYRAGKISTAAKSDVFGSIVTTSFGTLTLKYEKGTTTLDGELSRSTPCVDWRAEVKKIDTGISIDITDTNKGQVCVQSLGAPQQVHTTIEGVVPQTAYIVNLEDTTVFEGVLQAVTLPGTPTGGKVQ
jgi:hypothetical protein